MHRLAQIERVVPNEVLIDLNNYTGHSIGHGQLELLRVRDDGTVEHVDDPRETGSIPRRTFYRVTFPREVFRIGRTYRLHFFAGCNDDPSKVVDVESRDFRFNVASWRYTLSLFSDDVISRQTHGRLVRIQFPTASDKPTDVLASQGDVIEIDFLYEKLPAEAILQSPPKAEIKGGAHPEELVPAGSRPIVVDRRVVGVAVFLDARGCCEDWVTVRIAGFTHSFHIWVTEE